MSGFTGKGVLGRRMTRRAAVRGGVLGTGGLAGVFALACGDKKEVIYYPKGLGSLGYGFTKDIWLNK